MNYAEPFGVDETDKKHVVYRNFEAIEKGCLVDRENPNIHSVY
jgi:hypothetical protein